MIAMLHFSFPVSTHALLNPPAFPSSQSLVVLGKENATAAYCYSCVKYGETAWHVSLPLIRKKSRLISLCLHPVFPHLHRWYRQRFTDQLFLSVPAFRFLFCGPFVINRHPASIYIQQTHACRERQIDVPAYNNNAAGWESMNCKWCEEDRYLTRHKSAPDDNHSQKSSGLSSLFVITAA